VHLDHRRQLGGRHRAGHGLHGGVDDARELRDRALFAPATARRKVYVLDEVHMASTAAFNALLKLIEEPPEHVLFAMATTDPQKVLPTILSRVQRLDLRRVSAGDVADHVRKVCADEGYEIEDGAVDAVVRAGEGSVRDTLSVLEQVLAYAGERSPPRPSPRCWATPPPTGSSTP
jgi:DNA polymerase III subunit gamma/tau